MSEITDRYQNKERRKERRKLRAKPLFKKLGQKLGLAVYRYRDDFHYCPQIYGVGYWKKIRIQEIGGFKELADQVVADQRSLLYYDRLYILYQAIWNVRHIANDTVSMAEIGVYRGGGSYFIASVAERVLGQRLKIHSIDTFEGHPDDISAEDDSHWPGKFGNTSFEEVQKYLSGFPNLTVYKGRFEDRCAELEREKFCFVHVDVDIYAPTRACLEFFAERLLVGGVIVADDYGFTTCEGSKEAVDEFVSNRKNYLKFHIETGQSLLIRVG